MITVTANGTFWERHPEHPGGEVFIKADETVYVAPTDAVRRAIKDGRLETDDLDAGAPTPLTESFPGYSPLVDAGIETVEDVPGDRAALEAINGIGPKTAGDILEALT